MYKCESWTIKKTECWRIVAFNLWCWRRLLRFPQTARRSIQSIFKDINPEYSLEWLWLKLRLQYLATWCKEPTHWKRLILGKIEDKRGKDWQRMRCLIALSAQWTWIWPAPVHGVSKSQTWLSNWTATVRLLQIHPIAMSRSLKGLEVIQLTDSKYVLYWLVCFIILGNTIG